MAPTRDPTPASRGGMSTRAALLIEYDGAGFVG